MRTVYEAAGGSEGLRRLAAAWHERVMADEVVSHAFSHGYHPAHTERLAAYWSEALGGPATYSTCYGDESAVVRMHSGNGPHEEMDRRAIDCFDRALDDAGINGERLHQVLHEYFAWATTTTMARYHASADDVPDGLVMPHWSWRGLVNEDGPWADDELDALLAEQRAYYGARAGEYDATYPLDERADSAARRQLTEALEAHAPYGRALELACGTGQWTIELARHANALTAVDASPEVLAICRRRLDVPHVSLVQADVFAWRPEERYDFVFFAAWLSHVPPQRFDAFWALVADCLAPGGRVFVIDELPAGASVEQAEPKQPAPAVRRRLASGTSYRAVKVFYQPDELRRRLASIGWGADVRRVGWRYFYATARRLDPADAIRR